MPKLKPFHIPLIDGTSLTVWAATARAANEAAAASPEARNAAGRIECALRGVPVVFCLRCHNVGPGRVTVPHPDGPQPGVCPVCDELAVAQ